MLFNWTWYMGMLRGVDEHQVVTSLDNFPDAGLVTQRAKLRSLRDEEH
jgi:hypothetical protein